MWDCLEEITVRENMPLAALLWRVDDSRLHGTLSAAVRTFILNYFRTAATESGHASAGHGTFSGEKRRRSA
jgi:predicted DNA-binding ribbon-helix-helix protein